MPVSLEKAYRSAVALALMFAAAMWFGPGAVSAFAAERRIEVAPTSMREAVMITRVTVGGSEVSARLLLGPCKMQPITPFAAGDDWLQDIAISLFNRTNKTIAAEQINLRFPETGQLVYSITLGRVPASAAFFGKGKPGEPIPQDPVRQPMVFLPGQTMVVHVGDYFDQIRVDLERVRPLAANTRVIIDRGVIFFDDGMKWVGGAYSVPDSQHRGQWKTLDPMYFPGDREDNWPPGHRWAPIPCKE